ncbi:hypothetical protein CWATWH0005_2911 [Crocosphaera watsonii WH 0005]|uniref:Uncharacterized protein n=7 Tax=Crocosphaera watsonii TaxID=263511 RepID=Q4BUU9_CROWT|nr:hypothetical protein [Crocosphaera sp.]EAM47681.1 hypothetical protein CwatDRAFT_0438 [Crocosphaera watsonii WH 8501]NQZ62077.1 hypothetical protein [Crocosphaera sp.]CCQ55922.1 hypothetical protein CWATWH0005_2911 [Crocosphaera watsonii WH 0005]
MKSLLKTTSMISVFTFALFVNSAKSVPIKPSVQIAQQTPSIGREIRSFFESGRLTSEDRLSFQNPPDGVIPLRNQSNSWQFIVFRQGGVSFWMPPGILTEDEVLLATTLGDISFRSLASHRDNQEYIAAYAEGLTDEQIENIDVLLEAIKEEIPPGKGFQLTQQRAIFLDKNVGKELTFSNQEEIITLRLYLVKNRLYALGVRYPKSLTDTRSSRSFLNGLELLDN